MLVNLKKPLLTEDAIELINDLIDLPINPNGREIKNAYRLIKEDGMNEKIKNNIEEYFMPFKKLMARELKSSLII
jgi:hypothetical protein